MAYTQWTELPDQSGFTPAGETTKVIEPGYYDLALVDGRVFFVPMRARKDELLQFPASPSDEVIEGIKQFWAKRDKYHEYGITYKRGVLLYGPPGSGKTSTLQIISRKMVDLGGLVVNYHSRAFLLAYRALRDIQPEIPVLVLIEDFEELFTNTASKSTLLNLLDGVEELDNIVFLATCFTPNTRFLTTDLRWVPCGDLVAGDEIWAFDEDAPQGHGARRKFRRATITRSHRAYKECVRVTLDTGESYVCTTDHPWLTFGNYEYRAHTRWTQAKDLLGHQLIRPFKPWEEEHSYEAGWLAGMLDGEGSIPRTIGHGGPSNVTVAQNAGPIADRLAKAVTDRVDAHVYLRTGRRAKQQIVDTRGGLAAALTLLGRVRPERLISRVDLTGAQMLNKFPARVVAVENVGVQEIQSIETSTGTYIAEGFATHNTNYPEKLEPRVVNRPSRFDQVIRVPHPSIVDRRMYLETLAKHSEIDVERYARDTEGFGLAHVKELFIATVVLEQQYDDVLQRLKDMQTNRLTSLDDDKEARERTGVPGLGMLL